MTVTAAYRSALEVLCSFINQSLECSNILRYLSITIWSMLVGCMNSDSQSRCVNNIARTSHCRMMGKAFNLRQDARWISIFVPGNLYNIRTRKNVKNWTKPQSSSIVVAAWWAFILQFTIWRLEMQNTFLWQNGTAQEYSYFPVSGLVDCCQYPLLTSGNEN